MHSADSEASAASQKPRIVDSLAARAWDLVEKGDLTRRLFERMVEQVSRFVEKIIPTLSPEQGEALLLDYLAINGYKVVRTFDDGEFRVIETTLGTANESSRLGVATVMRRWSHETANRFVGRYSRSDHVHVLLAEKAPPDPTVKATIISEAEIIRTVLAVFLHEYFYHEYFHSVLGLTGFKDFMMTHLATRAGLSEQRLDQLLDGWENLKR